ncbi:MAG: hypothetical protein HY583_01070 [Candidatus Omnitrophica bacterium]|nr:hypothetical protein [Candidatus Omnitrophota bacterium]
MIWLKKIIFAFEYGTIRVISFLVRLLPFSFTLYLARPIGFILYALFPKPRQIAHQNLRLAFQNEKSKSEIRRIARGAFVHLAEFGIEWLRMPEMIRFSDRYLSEVKNKEKIYAELEKKNGAIVLVCHTGNWEIMALMGGLLVAKPIGTSVYAVARPLENPYLYDYAVKLRGGMGLKTIDKSGGVRETFDRLRKENAIVCILVDQRVSEGSVETHFFGRPALTTSLPVVAALRLGTPIFYNFLRRITLHHPPPKMGEGEEGGIQYEMQVEGPMPLERTGDFKEDIRVNTQKFISRIETEIRKNPARWLWMHNRWRVPHGPKD